MAAVHLDRMWLTDLVTQVSVSAYTSDGSRDQQAATGGEVRVYAGGRRRAITHPGVQRSWTFTLTNLPLDTVELLQAWLQSGVTVMARGHRGRYMYGSFFDLQISERKASLPWLYHTRIELHQVDVVEGV
jgi:hypothetical protein